MTRSTLYTRCAAMAGALAADLQAIPGPMRSAAAHNAMRHLLVAVRDLEAAAAGEPDALAQVDAAIKAARTTA